MAHKDIRLSQLLRVYIDGIPLDLASRCFPRVHGSTLACSVTFTCMPAASKNMLANRSPETHWKEKSACLPCEACLKTC
jgi:hypothetical protein